MELECYPTTERPPEIVPGRPTRAWMDASAPREEDILEVVRAQPDATFVELLVVLKKRGIRTSRSALWRFFGRHDITFKKKSICASERQRQDVVRARRKWIREQGLLDACQGTDIRLRLALAHRNRQRCARDVMHRIGADLARLGKRGDIRRR